MKDENAGEVALVCCANKTKAFVPHPQNGSSSQTLFVQFGVIALSLQENPIWTDI